MKAAERVAALETEVKALREEVERLRLAQLAQLAHVCPQVPFTPLPLGGGTWAPSPQPPYVVTCDVPATFWQNTAGACPPPQTYTVMTGG